MLNGKMQKVLIVFLRNRSSRKKAARAFRCSAVLVGTLQLVVPKFASPSQVSSALSDNLGLLRYGEVGILAPFQQRQGLVNCATSSKRTTQAEIWQVSIFTFRLVRRSLSFLVKFVIVFTGIFRENTSGPNIEPSGNFSGLGKAADKLQV